MRVVRRRLCRALAELIRGCRIGAVLLVAGSLAFIAATPAPSASPPPTSNSLTKAQMQALLPKVPLHTEYTVATNKLGQVTGVKPTKQSKDKTFDLQTFGNALQSFIRTADGKAISGVYKLSYDYDPKTGKVHRDVALVHPGGVDANAKGAALIMMDAARKEAAAAAARAKRASPAPHPVPAASGH